ncbi:Biotin carboxyl carrier protein of acetyl-CoA carboxylase [Arenibacter antarcticus]|uniref:Biotin carboxyl carrier protein of acetyl-CoA carboxylase n=1 Tax=Arenibacter antarcticus TaxID=2040469 RepID=A0ABW5V9V0_9FLAO|nr:acetyl-CoA carboxylase biotin carboxyl carrier protein [Arenibacter sp. H213]MCM4167755.1 acetyl-CoA carboxylase biotin carboxyl carrier protein [Arenibacter sp. H213]
MDIKEIQSLIKFVAKSGATEVKLEMEDLKITIRTGTVGNFQEPTYVQHMPMNSPMSQQSNQPAQGEQTSVEISQKAAAEVDDKLVTIKSPIIGTFYRKPSPDKPVFIEVGDTINKGDVLCVIEAMKLFNDIESEISGKIVKVLVDDSSPVEFDQPLFLVDPS